MPKPQILRFAQNDIDGALLILVVQVLHRRLFGIGYPFHAELHSTTLHIYAQDAHLDDLADGDDGEGVAHVAVGEFGDMHEAVLFDADIDEGAEVYDVAHRPL